MFVFAQKYNKNILIQKKISFRINKLFDSLKQLISVRKKVYLKKRQFLKVFKHSNGKNKN